MSLVVPPFHVLEEAVVFALGCGFDREIFGLHTQLARESGDCLRGRGFRRAHHALFAVGLAFGQAFGAQYQAAWRCVHRSGLVRNLQLLKQQPQVLQRPWNHPIGNLFRADFEQKRRH